MDFCFLFELSVCLSGGVFFRVNGVHRIMCIEFDELSEWLNDGSRAGNSSCSLFLFAQSYQNLIVGFSHSESDSDHQILIIRQRTLPLRIE